MLPRRVGGSAVTGQADCWYARWFLGRSALRHPTWLVVGEADCNDGLGVAGVLVNSRAHWAGGCAAVVLAVITAAGCTAEPRGEASVNPSASVPRAGRTSAASPNSKGLESGGAEQVSCAHAIGEDKPSKDVENGAAEVLGVVGLPTAPGHQALQANVSGDPNPVYRLFAKRGLLAKAASQFEIVVPPEYADRAALVWGNPGRPTAHLLFGPCASTPTTTGWLAYPGGYLVSEPMCLPLVVRSAGRETPVHIGVGRACPGQPTGPQVTPP